MGRRTSIGREREALIGFKILLWKAYFDKGFGLLTYLKYILAVVGVGAAIQGISLLTIFIVGVVYGVVCLILGRLWYHYKLVETEKEIENIFNPFVKEMRNVVRKKGKVFKV